MRMILTTILIPIGMVLIFASCSSREINKDFYKDISFEKKRGFKHSVKGLAFNKNVLLFAVGYESGKVELFDAKESQLLYSIEAYPSRATILNFSDDGKYLSVSGRESFSRIYDTNTGKIFLELSQTRGPELFVFNDELLFIADGRELKIFNLKTKTFQKNTYKCSGSIKSISLSHNEKYLSIGSTGIIQLFVVTKQSNLIDLELLSTKDEYDYSSYVTHSWFSIDDTELITLNRHGKMDIWTVPSLDKKENIFIMTDHVRGAILSEDRKSSVVVGIGKKGKSRKYYIETSDLEKKKGTADPILRTGDPNISAWSKMNDQEFVFIEHNKQKLLYRLSKAKEYNDDLVFKKKFDEYLSFPSFYKSFSVAYDNDKSYAFGFSLGGLTQEIANKKALEYCENSRLKKNIKSKCTIYAIGDERLER